MYSGQFDLELSNIKNNDYRKLTKDLLELLPDYFWEIPASSSGKYHPAYTVCEHGLVKHVKAAIKIAEYIMTLTGYDEQSHDIVIASLLLHDGLKNGRVNTGCTVHEHPILMANFVQYNRDLNTKYDYFYDKVSECIKSHMGKWTTSKYSDVVLPLPTTELQWCVHLSDYLASRECINIVLD